MLGKLLKYDLKYMIKNMSVFYILAILFAILSRILSSIDQSFMIGILQKITVGTMYAMLFNILINTIMRSWVRFRQSIYKDEAYLTHTLPVTKNDIYNSKFIESFIFFIIGFIIIMISLFITYYTKERWDILTEFLTGLSKGFDISVILLISGFILVVFLEIFNAIQCGFLGIVIGHRSNDKKVMNSVLAGVISYFTSQAIVLVLMYIIGLFNEGVMITFESNGQILDLASLKPMIISSIVVYIITITGMTLLSKYIFNKGVNIE